MKEKIIGTLIIMGVFLLIGLLVDKYYAIKIKRREKKLDDIMSDDKFNEIIREMDTPE